jgi:AcrR family transcriptional regulator
LTQSKARPLILSFSGCFEKFLANPETFPYLNVCLKQSFDRIVNNQMNDTKRKLLDVAESLFAERGISATSLRTIIAKAEVNLAAIHYHFGSKEALVQAVFRRRIEPMNQLRIQQLDDLENRTPEGAPALEELIIAFIGPPLRMKAENPQLHKILFKLFGQISAVPDSRAMTEFVAEMFEESGKRFLKAFGAALPHLTKTELLWRMRFMMGTVHAVMMPPPLPKQVACYVSNPEDEKTILKTLVPFLTAGLSAPACAADNHGEH